jgi:hypothetical protein
VARGWTKEEQWIVELLLDGEAEFLQALRRQTQPPLLQRVIRRHPRSLHKADRTDPCEYHWDLIFDEDLLGEYCLGTDVKMHIDDLHISDRRVREEIRVVGQVSNGLLTRIIARTPHPIRWPRRLGVNDWWYVLETEKGPWRSKRRTALQGLNKFRTGPAGSGEDRPEDEPLPVAKAVSAPTEATDPGDPAEVEDLVEQIATQAADDSFDQIVDQVARPAQQDASEPSDEAPAAEPKGPAAPEAPEPDRAGTSALAGAQIEDEGLAEEPPEAPQPASRGDDSIRAMVAGQEGVVDDDPGPQISPPAGEVAEPWLARFLAESFDSGRGVELHPPASQRQLAELAECLGGQIPRQYADLLACGNGGRLWGHTLLTAEEVAALGPEETDESLVPFALHAGGGAWAMDLSARKDGSCPVVRMARNGRSGMRLDSVAAWLEEIHRRAAERTG